MQHVRWRIAIPYIVLVCLVVLTLALITGQLLRQSALAQEKEELLLQASVLARDVREPLAEGDVATLGSLAAEYAEILGARLTIVAADGRVLADTQNTPLTMQNHLYRPEIQQAQATGQGTAVRNSDTLDVAMIYAAVRVDAPPSQSADGSSAGQALGYVRVAVPERDLSEQLGELRRTLVTVAVVAALFALALAVVIAESTSRPIRRLSAYVRRLAQGELDQPVLPTSTDEVGQLTADTMEMARRLRDTIASLNAERAQLSAVLDQMADAVLLTDREGAVILLNPAAQTLLHTSQEASLGRSFTQVVRQHELSAVWSAARDAHEQRAEVVDLGEQLWQVIVRPLDAVEPGACLVLLQDLTPLRRFEGLRREFVSNISHELRTPLASLRALADTLHDSALDDRPAAERFLGRMDDEIDALTQMVEELLELSRIESGRVPIRLERIAVAAFVEPAVERLRPQAERAQLNVQLDLPATLPAVLGDEQRLQQVVTNLVHNAIKFTPAGGAIRVTARTEGDQVVVSVSDTGIGIPAEAQARIFERFYKADRSRSSGGTGLGLAIAKHIVLAHGGRIWVESVEGQGSRFSFTVQAAPRSKAV
ncbi:MAG: ATP-binding protein [Anaerolineales bacterium]